MNKILGGTVNTTDNQVTAQVKAEPTVAKDATVGFPFTCAVADSSKRRYSYSCD